MHSPRLGLGPQSGPSVGFRSGSASSSPSASRTASPMTAQCSLSVSSGSSSGAGAVSPVIGLRSASAVAGQQGGGIPLRSPSRTLTGPLSKKSAGVMKSETMAYATTSSRTGQAGPGLLSGGGFRNTAPFPNSSEPAQRKSHH